VLPPFLHSPQATEAGERKNPGSPTGSNMSSRGESPGNTVGGTLHLLARLMLLYQATLDWFGCYKKLDLAGHPSFKEASLIKGFFIAAANCQGCVIATYRARMCS